MRTNYTANVKIHGGSAKPLARIKASAKTKSVKF